MAKLISVSEEVYDELSTIKGGMSFTELLKSLVAEKKKRGNINSFEKFFGILTEKDAGGLRKSSNEFRKSFKLRDPQTQ